MSCVVPNNTEVKSAIRHNKLDYEEMRQRLLETERKLQNLNKLEAEISDSQTFSNRGMRGRDYQIDDIEQEDLESIPSAISTVPGSYTGFGANNIPTSSPSRFEANRSNNKAVSYNGFESDSSISSTNYHSKYDLKLLKQNQRLLSEVERLVGDVHAANQKNADLSKEAENGKTVMELKDKCAGLVAENQAHDKSLREAERHLDEGQRRISELQKRLNHVEAELVETRAELSEVRVVKKEIESQRDEALHNFNNTQDSLEEYQKKMKEKIRKMEEKEDILQDVLSSTSQERDDLLDQLSSMEMSLASQEAQINRLLNDVSMEDARSQELEASNKQLKTQLNLMTEQIVDLENSKDESKQLKRERDNLKLELRGHRTLSKDLKALVKMLQQTSSNPADDSGNFSFKTPPLDYGMDARNEGGLLAAELNCNNNGLGNCEPQPCDPPAGTNMVCEMRNLVTNMDCEIQRLRCDLKQRDADDRTYANLRDELKVLLDKVESGMCHNRELECKVASLECDKKNLMCKLEEALGCLEERDRTLQCLETRLNERSVQIVCLQEELDDRNCRICSLENQIHEMDRKRREEDNASSMADSPALKEALSRIKELEAILICKNKSLDDLQEKLSKSLRELRVVKTEAEKESECLQNQLGQRDQDISYMREDAESMRQKFSSCQKVAEDLKKTSRIQLDKIACLSGQLDDLKYEKEATEQTLTTQLNDCSKKLCASQEQCADLENALAMCRNEVCNHLKKLEEIRATYEAELEQRDACIRKLKDDLRHTVEELKCKMEDNNSLEHSLAESRNKVQQICCQLKEADTNIQCLNIKIQEIEKQMLKEKSTCMRESEEMERRLSQACSNLTIATKEIDTLKIQLQERKNQVDCLQTEKTHMCGEIKKLSDQVACLQDQLKKMEADNQELCRQLQQKMECIRDMEDMIRSKDHELKCLTKYIQEKESDTQLNQSVKKLEEEVKSLKALLEKCREENKCKSTMLCECEEAFKHCQLLSLDKDSEIQMLKCQIETLNKKLYDRITRVDELEKGIENLHKDMERRMIRVDEQLKKYETELVDKIQEIATLKEFVSTCQLNLSEKVEELNQQEQKACLLTGELHSLSLKLKDAEDTRDHLGSMLSEKKGEVAELTQQLRLNREQMQSQHDDLVQCRQSLSCAQRDGDKLRREMDNALANLEHRECELSRLNEERKNLMEKVAMLTCQMEQETTMYRQQLSETKCRLEKELECLRNYSCQLESTNSTLTNKLSLCQRQVLQVEKCCNHKLESLSRSLEDLNHKLTVRNDELMSCRDSLGLKDSEICRLKKRLCSCEKPCMNDGNCTHNNNSGEADEGKTDYHDFQEDNILVESESQINLTESWSRDGVKNIPHSVGADFRDEDDDNRLSFQDSNQTSLTHRLSTPSETSSSRKSLGVTEVQERLRNNQLRQKEIERQLQSLEEVGIESLERQKKENEEEEREERVEDLSE